MRRVRVIGTFVIGFALAAACAPAGEGEGEGEGGEGEGEGDPIMPWSSGTRLRASLWDAGDGAVAFRGFVDTELDAPCEFAADDDGVLRCMPEGNDVVFEDDGCTQPLAFVGTCQEGTPAFARRTTLTGEGGCGTEPVSTVVPYAVGAEAAFDGVPRYLDGNGDCVPAPDVVAPFYEVSPIALDTLVSATETEVPVGEELAAVLRTAEDGASRVVRMVDRGRSSPCFATTLPQGVGCTALPSFLTPFGPNYADDACTEEVAYTYCGAREHIEEYVAVDDECGGSFERRYYVGGEEVDGPVYAMDVDQCVEATTLQPDISFQRLGEALTNDALLARVPALEVASAGAGRVVARGWAAAGGAAAIHSIALYDTELDTPCNLTDVGDQLLCLPYVSTASDQLFSDDACTVPLAYGDPDDPCATGGSFVLVAPASGICVANPADVRIHALGPAHTGDVYFKDGASCFVVTGTEPLRAIGPEAADAFVAVVERVE